MQRFKAGIVRMTALSVVLALGAAACGSDDKTTAGSGDTTPTTAKVQLTGTLKGSGATFPKAFYEVAIESFKAEQPGLTIEYAGGGSGTGRQNLQDGVVDFAGSDGLVKDEDKPKYKGEFLYFPTVAAPITVSYNIDVTDLVLDADTIAKIFQRQITKWDDEAIKTLNMPVEGCRVIVQGFGNVGSNAARILAVTLMQQHGLVGWTFKFDHARRRFGCCNFTRRTISLSRPLTFLNDDAEVRDTILHEIAHALAGLPEHERR